ncbi:MAG: hypothetical protein CMH52_02510 [Myxococcales bacterium]|nr:hypothetical protein [Myxococcales bacterium]|tara:strand:- start:60 stop:1277 length:1218 start_codon:yes stop_codon:yes gene_type:complete
MVDFIAFKAWRPRTELAQEVAAVPYDVVDTDEARALVKDAPNSLLRVTRPDVDLPDGASLYGESSYQGACAAFERLVSQGVLVEDEQPNYYAYAQHMGDHVQTGLVGLVTADDYWADRIKKHEFTRPTKEDDRMRHIDAVRAHLGPVFLAYRAQDEIDQVIAQVTHTAPDVDFVAADGIRHQVWPISDPKNVTLIEGSFAKLDALYIADGHHRAAAASRIGKGLDKSHAQARFLSVAFPDSELKILPYNRVVLHRGGHSVDSLLAKLECHFEISKLERADAPSSRQQFSMFLAGQWYRLDLRDESKPDPTDPVERLDVSVLQNLVLDPLLGIEDPRTDNGIIFVGGIRGLDELEKKASSNNGVAFSLFPTSLAELMDIADAGQVMPPKSTWFEPKLRSGLMISRY